VDPRTPHLSGKEKRSSERRKGGLEGGSSLIENEIRGRKPPLRNVPSSKSEFRLFYWTYCRRCRKEASQNRGEQKGRLRGKTPSEQAAICRVASQLRGGGRSVLKERRGKKKKDGGEIIRGRNTGRKKMSTTAIAGL